MASAIFDGDTLIKVAADFGPTFRVEGVYSHVRKMGLDKIGDRSIQMTAIGNPLL
ncbi:MAG: hypothetical protein AAGD09_21440 [Cyanobacteria bacterium P01_F01_bin.56]